MENKITSESDDTVQVREIDREYPTELLPPIVKRYLEIVSVTTNGSHAGAAMALFAVLSALYGRGYRLWNGMLLNDFHILCGKSGVSRKTTLMKIASELLKRICEKRVDLGIQKFEKDEKQMISSPVETLTSFSVEGLESAFRGRGVSCLALQEEYRTLLSCAARSGQQNTIPAITRFYDCNDVQTTLRNQRMRASDYAFSILAGSTHQWLRDAFSSDNIGGGFLNRHLIAYCKVPEKLLIDRREISETEWSELVDLFEKFVPVRTFAADDEGPAFYVGRKTLQLNENAKDLFSSISNETFEAQKKMDDLESDLLAREEAHMLKLAGHHAILSGMDSINHDALYFAYEWVKTSSSVLLDLVRNQNLGSDEVKLLQRIKAFYVKNGNLPVKKSQISRDGGKQDRNNKALKNLIEKGFIVEEQGMYLPASPR